MRALALVSGYLKRGGRGATSIEYALIAAFISIVIVGAVTAVGTSLDSFFGQVASGFN
ncbi:Flp family type IVb pilin [Roseospira navarrensis]|uniref:Flp family type IVb pilin n=1 Tax=Roseospira navarrensis TaxID=140058 RepID=A0A7X2D2S8_9PROT|nr:Flp family type IVb pilin [Roseospira navarrensis]MQX36036.1 Flp family type IVb pilin [Roseospira navarrensis]